MDDDYYDRGMDHNYSCGWRPFPLREGGYKRRFFTKAEKIEKLKNYANELKKELAAVEEKIKEMKE